MKDVHIEHADSGLKTATSSSDGRGTKEVVFKTVLLNEKDNIIGLHIISDDGGVVNKVVNTDSYGFGNDVAVAMDALTNMSLPIGTEFEVTIKFKIPEEV